jgi:hypothetical protein
MSSVFNRARNAWNRWNSRKPTASLEKPAIDEPIDVSITPVGPIIHRGSLSEKTRQSIGAFKRASDVPHTLIRTRSHNIDKICEQEKCNNDEELPRITIIVDAHGGELIKTYKSNSHLTGLGSPFTNKIRIFSFAAELGVCNFSKNGYLGNDYMLNKNNAVSYAYYILNNYLDRLCNSTYLAIKFILSSAEKDYSNYLSMMKKENFTETTIKETLEEYPDFFNHLDAAMYSAEEQKHIRTYVPVNDKIYDFRDKVFDRYAAIVHSDKEISFENFTFNNKDSLKKLTLEFMDPNAAAARALIEDEALLAELSGTGPVADKAFAIPDDLNVEAQSIIDKIDSFSTIDNDGVSIKTIRLSDIYEICQAWGFKTINIIDYSCRSIVDAYDDDPNAVAIKEAEKGLKSTINRSCGGGTKRRSRRQTKKRMHNRRRSKNRRR